MADQSDRFQFWAVNIFPVLIWLKRLLGTSICFRDAVGRKRGGSPGYSLDGVLDARDGEEGGEVGRVGGDDDEREHPPHPHHHARGQRGVRHLSACREETSREKKWA